MSWYVFAWSVLPTGFLLALMLASGQKLQMRIADTVLSAPFALGPMNLSLAVIMVAFCAVMAMLQYSIVKRSGEKLVGEGLAAGMLYDLKQRDVFRQERNLYLTLLGLTYWAFAWRLKALHDRRQVLPPSKALLRREHRPLVSRIFFAALGIGALLLADVPLCRINYNLQLHYFVTPEKERLLSTDVAARCAGIFARDATRECADFCLDVRKVSQARLEAIFSARDWHLTGRLMAEMFDEARGVKQGGERIDKLFARKTCTQVLQSVDKSNQLVNWLCVGCAGASILLAMVAFTAAADEPHGLHED